MLLLLYVCDVSGSGIIAIGVVLVVVAVLVDFMGLTFAFALVCDTRVRHTVLCVSCDGIEEALAVYVSMCTWCMYKCHIHESRGFCEIGGKKRGGEESQVVKTFYVPFTNYMHPTNADIYTSRLSYT